MVQITKSYKNFGIIGSAFIGITIILALVVFFSMQTLDSSQRKYSMSVLNEVASNHAQMIHMFVEAAKGQAKNYTIMPDGTYEFIAQRALQDIIDPSLKNHIEFYILNKNGTVISAIGEEIEKGANALSTLGIKKYDRAKPAFFSLYVGEGECYVSLVPMRSENWTAVALLPVDGLREDAYSSLYFVIAALCVWIVFCTSFAFYFMYSLRKTYVTATAYADKLHETINEIPCGIVRCLNDEAWTIVDYSESLPTILGIGNDEISTVYNNCWRDFIHPDDSDIVKNMVPEVGGDVLTAEYRIKRKDGSSIYVMDRTKLVETNGESWLWCVILDVNDLKKSQVQEHNMVGRYKHLLEMSDNVLYEYDIESDQLSVSLEFFKKFEYALPDGDELNYYPIDSDIIHADDMDLFKSMQMRIKVGGKVTAALLRIKKPDDDWIWCQLRQTAWTDDKGKLKAIGKIDNVDKETRTLQKLQDDVQRDSFTSLYNKVATEELINKEIIFNPDARGAFCIIDIDNFKMVNSSFGHAMGDMVIKNLANGLSHIFRSNDIVGRIGGDEFIVYIKNMPNLRPLLQKVDNVQEYFRQTFEDNNVKVSISCSIGIALFPKDGESYDELYRRADKALYRSKMTKDAYHFYDAELDEE